MIPSNSFLFFNPLRLQSLFRRTYIDFFDTLIPMILLTFLKHTVVFSSFFGIQTSLIRQGFSKMKRFLLPFKTF